jgi:RimJ/RimL family protein N-acetyltransferase
MPSRTADVRRSGPVLETNRLHLRPCRSEDLERIHVLWTNDRVLHFLFDERVMSRDEARTFVDASCANFARYGYGLWLVFARGTDQLLGFAGFLRGEEADPWLIYGVHPEHWGAGYATEAARAVVVYAFDNLALEKIIADVDEPNVASVRVLEKLGLKRVNRAMVNGRPLLYFEVSKCR